MYAGLDFGTSNSAIGIWCNDEPCLLKLDHQSRFISSTLFVHKSEQFLDLRPEEQTLYRALSSNSACTYGKQAIEQFLAAPDEGFFIKSPKSFLGARLKTQQLAMYERIVFKMIENIKLRAEEQTSQAIEQIVIGKPVKFHGTQGEAGNQQAMNVLRKAALTAGFKNIEFQFEPIAAALDYERTLTSNVTALIVDIGGGTTDCSMICLGPTHSHKTNRDETILGYSGDRVGGLDLDIRLSYKHFSPLFGKDEILKNGLPTPAMLFWNAVCINNIDAQTTFYSPATGREIEKLLRDTQPDTVLNRLQLIFEENLSYQISQTAEMSKIQISEHENISVPFNYIENDLSLSLSRNEFADCIQQELEKFIELMQEVEKQAAVTPDVIYVTGGTARSPIVDTAIRQAFPTSDIIFGDLFGSVSSGLTTWANRIFS